MINFVVTELVSGEDQGRHEVRVPEPRTATAARQEAENVPHDVVERRRRVGGPREHRGTVRRQVQPGAVLGTRVSPVLPLGAPVLHER